MTEIEAVTARLDQAHAALAAAEQEYAEQALAAALSDDPTLLADIEKTVGEARLRVETLGLAEAEAQRREKARLAEARTVAEKARIRAINQHVATLVKTAASFAHFTERQIDSYRAMIRAGRALEGALKPDENRQHFGGSRSLEVTLDLYVAMEVARAGIPRSDQIRDLPRFPLAPRQFGSFGGLLPYGQALHQAKPIDEALKARYGGIGAALSGAQPSPPAEPQPEAASEPPISPVEAAEPSPPVAVEPPEDIIFGTPISVLRENARKPPQLDIEPAAPEIFADDRAAEPEIFAEPTAEDAALMDAVSIAAAIDDAEPPSAKQILAAVNTLTTLTRPK